jgi:hypothetical protein
MSAAESRRARAEALKGTSERRAVPAGDLEVRDADGEGFIRMAGYGSVTGVPYQVGGFTETIRRGAFKRTLSEDPHVVLLYGHDGMPFASTKNGTLALTEDDRGLRWAAKLDAEDPDSQTLTRKVRSGLIDECSFSFRVTDDDWSADHSKRVIRSVVLHHGDVSLVVHGANPATSVAMRTWRPPDFTSRARQEYELLAAGGRLSTVTRSPRNWYAGERAWLARQRDRAVVLPRPSESRTAKYTQAQVDQLGAQGKAFKHTDGTFAFPIADEQDLQNAIRAVGRTARRLTG